jgi:phosphohistidine phosphatase SixA
MRHLHTPEGVRDPDLTDEGQHYAERLDRWFRNRRLTSIYASEFKRTRQTVAPLTRRLRVVPKIYDPADTEALLRMVRRERGPVLIVGHSNTVPDIVEGLGGTRPAPMSHHDFGDIWIVQNGGAKREAIPIQAR